jgi:hypothetical protein
MPTRPDPVNTVAAGFPVAETARGFPASELAAAAA